MTARDSNARSDSALQGPTPGPWAYRPNRYDDWGFVRSSDGELVAVAKDSSIPLAEHADYRARKADPYEANACLIAAAPDMFASLRIVMQNMEDEAQELGIEPEYMKGYRSVQAAIAKALPHTPRGVSA